MLKEKNMKKIEILRDMFKSVGGILNSEGYCGQYYNLELKGRRYDVWVDNLPGGRVSIKVKYFKHENDAALIAMLLDNKIMHKGATNTKADTYKVHVWDHVFLGYGARLICDKPWD